MLPLCSLLMAPSSPLNLGRHKGSSRWSSLLPQGWVPWLLGQHWHRAICCMNCAPGVAGSAKACAGRRPCPIVRVSVTFPMRMLSFLHCRIPKVASSSKSIPKVNRAQAQLLAAPDAAPPTVVPGLQDNCVAAR